MKLTTTYQAGGLEHTLEIRSPKPSDKIADVFLHQEGEISGSSDVKPDIYLLSDITLPTQYQICIEDEKFEIKKIFLGLNKENKELFNYKIINDFNKQKEIGVIKEKDFYDDVLQELAQIINEKNILHEEKIYIS